MSSSIHHSLAYAVLCPPIFSFQLSTHHSLFSVFRFTLCITLRPNGGISQVTAPESYGIVGDELVFDRRLGRPRNTVVLPRNWCVTASSIPAVITQTPDNLTQLRFFNRRPDDIGVLVKARRCRRPD